MNDQNPRDTDQVCQATLQARLSVAPGLGNVDATVSNGVAVLTGTVQDEMDIRRCVLIAQAVDGIREVREKLRVAAPNAFQEAGSALPTTEETPPAGFAPGDVSLNPSSVVDEITLADVVKEGMEVFDSEGKKVGKVKEVRPTDFLLGRMLLARNYYVPYLACTVSEDGVHLKVKGSEINDQGWAFPHMETP